MNYLVVSNDKIANIVVAKPDVAEEMGFLPWYEGARIGDFYSPPEPEPEPTVWDELAAAIMEGVNAV